MFKMSKNLSTKTAGDFNVNVCKNSFLKKKKFGEYSLEVRLDGKLVLRENMGMSEYSKGIKLAKNEEQISILFFQDDGYSAVHDNNTQDHFITGKIVSLNGKTGKIMDTKIYMEYNIDEAYKDFKNIQMQLEGKQRQQDGREM